jgi:asparagine synthase (glutamine-hydrolysing)
MLDGQGADEMLGGYISYQGSRLATLLCNFHLFKAIAFLNKSSKLPGRSKKMMNLYAANELIPDWSRAIARMLISKGVPPKWLSNNWLQKNIVHIHPRIISRIPGKDKLRARLLESLTRSSIPRLLRYEDRNSMHFSIESRVPFLHIDLVEYIYSLPEEFLISPNGTSKYVFREAMRGIVPDAILDRNDKIGFATPEKSWLSNMENWVFEQLKYAEKLPCFDPSALIEEWNNVIHGRVAFDFRCWRWLNLIAWVQSNGIEVGQ